MLTRIAVAFVTIPILLFFSRVGGLLVLVLVEAIVLVGLREFYALWEARGIEAFRTLGMVGAAMVGGGAYLWPEAGHLPILTLLFLGIMVSPLLGRSGMVAVSITVLGVLYLGWLGSHLILLRELPRTVGGDYASGGLLLIFTLVLSWAGDTVAYFVGLWCGRHKLSPRISPNKTVEGAVGHGLGALTAALISWRTFLDFLPVHHCLAMGVIATSAGQAGDLVESLLKREAEIKDTSGLIPGHGGVLDRFDSLLFIAPLEFCYLRFIVFR